MRTLAIGDIHGCLGPLNDLLDWMKPTTGDVVVLLGDYVDRGPDSRGVIDRILQLKQAGMPLVCLRGNHEIMMQAARHGGRGERAYWLSVGGVQTLGSYGPSPGRAGRFEDVPPEHWAFMETLLDYHETDRHIFVHAGVCCELPMDEQPEYVLFWEFLTDQMRHRSGKRVICGHTSQRSGEPKVIPGAVCIDTRTHGDGWLTCLNADTGQYWQVDLLGQRREGYVDFEE